MELANSHHRSNLFIASFQAEGLCQAMRLTISVKGIPGPASISLLRNLRELVAGAGIAVEHLPNVAEDMDPFDVLMIAEVVRATILAFLTPEEAAEQRGVFGFHAIRDF